MDYSGIGKQFEGLAKLAMFGAACYLALLGLLFGGSIWLLVWAWNHISFH